MTHTFIPHQECKNCKEDIPHINCGPYSTEAYECIKRDGHEGNCVGAVPYEIEGNLWKCGLCDAVHQDRVKAKGCDHSRIIKAYSVSINLEKGRLERNEYYCLMTELISQRSTCPRKSVGALIVKENRIISTGYNGSPHGLKHCVDVGCKVVDNHCIRTIHAEMNALLFAGRDAKGAVMYTNVLPCPLCLKLAVQAGITKIYYKEEYKLDEVRWLMEETDMELIRWEK